jgi:hypothetical protein
MKDALRKHLSTRTFNLAPNEQICDIIVTPSRDNFCFVFIFLYFPAIIVTIWTLLDIFQWSAWWVWGVLALLYIFPVFFRQRMQAFMGFELWIWTNKTLHWVKLGRELGETVYPIMEMSYPYLDIKCASWYNILPESVARGKATLHLFTDFQFGPTSISVPLDLHRVKRTVDSLLHFAHPSRQQLREYLQIHYISFNPTNGTFTFPVSEATKVNIAHKKVKGVILFLLFELLNVLIVWGAFQASLVMGWLFSIFGGLFGGLFIFCLWDCIHRVSHYENKDAQSLEVTPEGVKIHFGDAKPPRLVLFSPDGFTTLLNALKTYRLDWSTMDSVEIYHTVANHLRPIKLGLLNHADLFPFYFRLVEAYNIWLEHHAPDYLQLPTQIRSDFIKSDPFHQEILDLIEKGAERSHEEAIHAPERYLTLSVQKEMPFSSRGSRPVQTTQANASNLKKQIRYSIASYTPRFDANEHILYIYHPPHPSHVWKSTFNLVVQLASSTGAIISGIAASITGSQSGNYLLFIAFAMMLGTFWLLLFGMTLGEYFKLRAMEIVFTPLNIYYQTKFNYEVVPYAKILEVQRVQFDPHTGEYRKVRFIRKERPLLRWIGDAQIDTGMPDGISHVPRDSPMFTILSILGVPLSEV